MDEPSSGFVQLTFPITRDDKTIGDVNVTWSITPAANRETGADADDFKEMSGTLPRFLLVLLLLFKFVSFWYTFRKRSNYLS